MNSTKNNWIDLYSAVKTLGRECGSRYKDTIKGHDALITFLDANAWFGVNYKFDNDRLFVDAIEEIESHLDLWLEAYGRSISEKIRMMLNKYKSQFPETCNRFVNFVEKNDILEMNATSEVLDFLLFYMDKELIKYDDDELHCLVDKANQELTLVGMRLMTDFFKWEYRGNRISSWEYRFFSRQIEKNDYSAYDLKQFSFMAYTIFSRESWDDRDLVSKAAKDRIYADLWLFTALHFICALRRPDIRALPIPKLPYTGDEIRRRILNGTFNDQEARAISHEVIFRSQMKARVPQKTKRYQSVPNIKIFFPESIVVPMGTIIALSLSYHKDGEPFVECEAELTKIRSFFGEDFANILDNKRFSSRKANRAYMQGLDSVTDDIEGKPKGYMIAALARSHKGGISSLPDTTDVYLHDANFSGYKPEFIIREMFERGVFGFIPVMLMEKLQGSAFKELDVHSQTEIINQIGLDAEQLENVTDVVMRSKCKARLIVDTVTNNSDTTQLFNIIQKISAGAAPARQAEYLCLMTAAGYPCCYRERSSCVGCGYEIYTKSAAHLLMSEYINITTARNEAKGIDRTRLSAILDKAIVPAISQILESIQLLYPDMDMEPIYLIVERGIQSVSVA